MTSSRSLGFLRVFPTDCHESSSSTNQPNGHRFVSKASTGLMSPACLQILGRSQCCLPRSTSRRPLSPELSSWLSEAMPHLLRRCMSDPQKKPFSQIGTPSTITTLEDWALWGARCGAHTKEPQGAHCGGPTRVPGELVVGAHKGPPEVHCRGKQGATRSSRRTMEFLSNHLQNQASHSPRCSSRPPVWPALA